MATRFTSWKRLWIRNDSAGPATGRPTGCCSARRPDAASNPTATCRTDRLKRFWDIHCRNGFVNGSERSMRKPARRRIDVNLDELDRVLDSARQAPLNDADYEKIKDAL